MFFPTTVCSVPVKEQVVGKWLWKLGVVREQLFAFTTIRRKCQSDVPFRSLLAWRFCAKCIIRLW